MARIAFIGLGVMGAPMARHLAAAGHQLTVYNRTTERAHHRSELARGRDGGDAGSLCEMRFEVAAAGALIGRLKE